MRAVCILWAFALFSAEMSEKLTFAQKISDDEILAESETGHGGHSGPDPFVDVNSFLISVEAEEWTHGHDLPMTKNRMKQAVFILLYRFGCSSTETDCMECAENITDHVFHLVHDDDDVISEEEFEQASIALFHMTSMESMEAACGPEGWLTSVDGYTDAILNPNGVLTEEELDLLLDDMIDKYTPISQSQCFGVESLFDATVHEHEAGAQREEIPALTSLAVSYLVQGYCIGLPTTLDPHEFTHDVFAIYGAEGIITEEEYGHLLEELSIGGASEHVHAHGDAAARKKRQTDHNHDHDHEHPGEGHIEDVTTTCFTGEELWDIYGIDHETGMNEAQFEEMCPSLIQQMVRHVCEEEHSDHVVEVSSDAWLYGTLAVVIVSLASVLGGLLIPWLSPEAYEKFVYSLISLAVAILVGDALIHLLPLATGLHAIDHNHAAHSPTDPEMAYIWKSLACLMAVYFFYVFETLMGWFSGHDHSVTPAVERLSMTEAGEAKTNGALTKSISKSPLTENVDSTSPEIDPTARHWLKRYGPVPVMIIIGDTLHNLGDGLAIGASFAEGMGPGISTTLAVFCHEVPHELGDLGVLLKLGIKLKWALLLNLLSSLSAFAGLYIGLGLAQTEEARQWIFAITAGIFIYVALADMVPQITNIRETKSPWLMFCLQNVFFLCGIAFILVLALYEDDISVSI